MRIAEPAAALHDIVRLRRELDGFAIGTIGTIVSSHPETDSYLLELEDERGIDTAEGRRGDFELVDHPS